MQAPPTPLPSTMRALTQPRYGGPEVLRSVHLPVPQLAADQVLVEVHASTVSAGDLHLLTGRPYLIRLMGFGLLRPKCPITGMDVAGRVVAVGPRVQGMAPGDAVFGELPGGCHADYVAADPSLLAPLPRGCSFAQAAAMPTSAVTALQALRDHAEVRPGERVLINGASGGVGSFAIQLAKAMGAEVTAVCGASNADQARELGAAQVLDYRSEDFTRGDRPFDVVLDLVSNHPPAAVQRVLTPAGRYIACGQRDGGDWVGTLLWFARIGLAGALSKRTIKTMLVEPRRADLLELARLFEAGELTPRIARVVELEHAPEAFRYVHTGRAAAKVVVQVRP